MGAHVTVAGPPTLIPRDIGDARLRRPLRPRRPARGRRRLRAADAERAHRPALPAVAARVRDALPDQRPPAAPAPGAHAPRARSTAASSSPGEVVDSPQAVITAQVEGGVVVRMAVLYELLEGARAPASGATRREAAARMSDPLVHRAAPPADLLIRGAHVLDPRTGIDGHARRPRPRRRDRRDRRARHRRGARRAPRSSTARAGTSSRPSSTRTCTCARPARSTRRTSRPAPAPRRPAGSARSSRCRTPTRSSTRAPILRALRDAAAREARVPVGFLPCITRGMAGEQLTEMAELRELGALGFTDDGRPVVNAADPAPGAAVPADGRAACSPCTRRTRRCRGNGAMHEGEVSARARHRRDPELSESTMVARDAAIAGYEGGRIHIQHLSLRRVGARRSPTAKARGVRISRRGQPAPPDADRRGGPAARHADEDEPAAARRARPPGAHRRAARRDDRLRRHRPRAARARREGGPVRAGADGDDRPGDRVRRAVHRPRAARACCRWSWSSRGSTRAPRCSTSPTPRIEVGPPRRPHARRPRRGVDGRRGAATRAARRTAASPAARCAAASCSRSPPARWPTASGRSRLSAGCARSRSRRERHATLVVVDVQEGFRKAVAGLRATSRRRPRRSSRRARVLGAAGRRHRAVPAGARARRSDEVGLDGEPVLEKTVFAASGADGLRPAGPRPGDRLRHRGPRLRAPDRRSTCARRASRSTSPPTRSPRATRANKARRAAARRAGRGRPDHGRDGAARAVRRAPAPTSSRRSRG